MTHVFKHPKFYRIPRDKTDQAISRGDSTEAGRRASDPGLKQQAASSKRQATSLRKETVSTVRPKTFQQQAASFKTFPQSPNNWTFVSIKRQATSDKLQAARAFIKFYFIKRVTLNKDKRVLWMLYMERYLMW